jgi:hypothetical protein
LLNRRFDSLTIIFQNLVLRTKFRKMQALANTVRTYEWLKSYEPLGFSVTQIKNILRTENIRTSYLGSNTENVVL